jgi:hypothetical protein
MASEDDIGLPVDAREGSSTASTLLLRLTLFGRFSSWWGRRQRLERSAVADEILEVPAVS